MVYTLSIPVQQSRSWIPVLRRQLSADSAISSLSYRTDSDWNRHCDGRQSFLRWRYCCPAPVWMVRSWSKLYRGCFVCSMCFFCICCDSQLWSPERERLICTLDMKVCCSSFRVSRRGLEITTYHRIYVFAWEATYFFGGVYVQTILWCEYESYISLLCVIYE